MPGVFLVVLLLAGVGFGATYYLNNESAGGDGTTAALTGEHAAFASPAAVLAALRAEAVPHTVIVFEGDGSQYVLQDTTASSRTADAWLTWQAADGESPMFRVELLPTGTVPRDQYYKFDGLIFSGAFYERNPSNHAHVMIQNSNYVTFKDCTWQGVGWDYQVDPTNQAGLYLWTRVSNVTLTNCSFIPAASGVHDVMGYGVAIRCGTGVDFDTVTISGCEAYGHFDAFQIGGTNWTISDCAIHDCIGDGIRIVRESDGIIIEDTDIYNLTAGIGTNDTDCLQFNTVVITDVTVRRCKFYNSARQLISMNPDVGSGAYVIENNVFHSANWNTEGLAGAVTVGANVNGLKFNNNTLVAGADDGGAGGTLNLAAGATITELCNNIIERLTTEAGYTAIANEDYNIYSTAVYVNTFGAHTQQLGEVDFRAMFVDYAGGDYRLVADAEAVDAGDATYAPATDIDGTARPQGAAVDIGAYEFIATIGDEVVTNYRSGIDVTFGGQAGEDWTQEYFYHDPLVDDSKVVYIKSSTPIFMAHNDRNRRQTNISNPTEKIIGRDGEDGIPDSGDEGIIRYRVDEDLYVNTSEGFCRVYWSRVNAEDSHTRYKAYTGPLTFASLTYRDGTPVVGSVGPNQEDITDRGNAYWYGVLDEFGDEWHTFAYADDDEFLFESPDAPFADGDYEKLASDGKILLFVVNPKTPCIRFTAQEGGQFYTTPPKAYNIPVVHPQTTYLSGNVTVTLTNIADDAPCYFRFYEGAPSGEYTRYTAQAMADGVAALMDGVPYTLEYYCDPEHKKKRTIVRNPGYPSAGESHGYMLWRNDDEFEAIKGRLTRDRYLYYYNLLKSRGERNDTTYWDSFSRQGHRIDSSAAIINAFIAAVEGWDYVVPGTAKSYVLYAKEMLLENVLNLDPLWFGDESATPDPSHELLYRGYYDVRPVMSAALAYDLLIAHFRADQHSGGITPIEDYKIRDMLAKWNIMAMMEVGRFGAYGHKTGAQGMWATARGYGALINAVVMPSYDTPYFGTSGFDGKAATHPWTPYRDYPKSWKDVFFSPSETSPDELVGFPNMAMRADWARRGSSTCPLIIEEAGEINGFSVVMGDWADRGSYLGSHNFGMPLTLFANVLKISQGKTYPHIERLFERVADGVAISADDGATIRRPYLLLVNEHFAGTGPAYEDSVAAKHEAYMASFPAGHAYTSDEQMTGGSYGVYSLILYHDDWRQYVKADSAPGAVFRGRYGSMRFGTGKYGGTGRW